MVELVIATYQLTDLTHTSQLFRDKPSASRIFNNDYTIVRKDVKFRTITMSFIPIDNCDMVAVTAKAVNKGLARSALIGEMIGESGKFVVDVVVQRIAHCRLPFGWLGS
jgi:hypothetical protein